MTYRDARIVTAFCVATRGSMAEKNNILSRKIVADQAFRRKIITKNIVLIFEGTVGNRSARG